MTQPTAGLVCPNGHLSEENDYCSVCGAPMQDMAADGPSAMSVPTPPVAVEACPSCGTPRADPTARFCEVCRYDYQTRAPGPPPVVVEAAAAAPEASDPGKPTVPAPPPTAPASVSRAEWEVTIVVDPSLDADPDLEEPPPSDIGDRVFPIDLPEMLVGRRDDAHQIRPEIPVVDPGVSRRHAYFLRLSEGKLSIVDLASANGTTVNGVGMVAGERHELGHGDVVTIGRWTRITVRRRDRVGP